MSEYSSDGDTLSGTATLFVVALVVFAVLITSGGFIRSLGLIGVGTVVLAGAFVWSMTSSRTPSSVPVAFLVWVAGIYLGTAGLYFNIALFWMAAVGLLFGHAVWTRRSRLTQFIAQFSRGKP